MEKRIIIAIDGYSSCGKSTMAKELARQLGYIYIDTGAMYRAVTLYALRENLIDSDGTIDTEQLRQRVEQLSITFKASTADGRPDTCLDGENVEGEIRSMAVSRHVSNIAALPFVRKAMVRQQQAMGEVKGIVMDGRDIGTTVFPQAELKIFVTARAEVRARRRYDELTVKGQAVSFDDVLHNVRERDYKDTHRDISPLRQAADAIVLDNSDMTREEQNTWLLQQAKASIKKD